MIKRIVKQYIENNHLFGSGARVLVALSGGADSIALVRVLLDLGFYCEAAHCNFHLRGDESDRDERFVKDFVDTLGVKLHKVDFATEAYAAERTISIEMAARELRYEWFESVREKSNCDVIAVAHHKDDSVETVLLNLIRGTGINGLRGIQPKNGRIVRPLLCVERKDIIEYLNHLGQKYVTDSTNLQDEYTRNKIRLNVIPLLQTINPSVADAISETASRLSGVADIYRNSVNNAIDSIVCNRRINIALLLKESAPENILFEILYPLGFNSSQIMDVFNSIGKESGKTFYSSHYTLLLDREELIWKETDEKIIIPTLKQEYIDVVNEVCVKKDKREAYLDAALIAGPLTIRKWKSGDKFIPFGMKGYKKVRDYLRDKKFSLFEKQKQCVVCSGNEIVWLVNERIDERFKVSSETKRILKLTAE